MENFVQGCFGLRTFCWGRTFLSDSVSSQAEQFHSVHELPAEDQINDGFCVLCYQYENQTFKTVVGSFIHDNICSTASCS